MMINGGSNMASWTESRREERLNAYYDPEEIISTKTYNTVMGAVVLEGLIVNYIICLMGINVYESMNPLAFIIGYFIFAFAGIMISKVSKNPFISFVGYNMLVLPMGLSVSAVVEGYGGISSDVVRNAFLLTAIITFVMIGFSMLFEDFFAKIGGVLMAGLLGALLAGGVAMLMGMDLGAISFFVAILFAFYIGYDFYRSQQFEKTYDNAVDCAVDIYLDIINLFLRIVRILGRSSGNSRRR